MSLVRIATVCLLIVSLGAAAQETEETGEQDSSPGALPAPEVSPPGPLSSALPNLDNIGALEAFLDGIVETYREEEHVAGVTLSIVRNGQIILEKGYGFSGLDPHRPVDPEATLFRVGSISKTFIWVSLMQLVESGEISLRDPVNDYLPERLRIPDQGFEEPIRIRHLLSHTPGFEDSALGHLFVREEDKILPLDDYLARYRPNRVRAPGKVTSYSNYGAALGGFIVQQVSGLDFQTYVERNIYEPLGMTGATFREPYAAREGLPAPMAEDLAANLSEGFRWKQGWFEEQGPEYITPVAPAGAMSATARDMARYMLALLNEGTLEGGRILRPDTVREMRQTLFANAEGAPGFAYGFIEYPLPGDMDGWGHGGATLYFQSNMIMVPELDLGVFISTNSAEGSPLSMGLMELVMARFFAGDTETPAPPEDFSERAARYAGTYLLNRTAHTKLEKVLLSMPGGFTTVSATQDSYLLTSSPAGTSRWVEIAPNQFRRVGGHEVLYFIEDENGEISHFSLSLGIFAWEKTGFFAGPQWFNLIAVLGFLATTGSILGFILRRKRPADDTKRERIAVLVHAIASWSWAAFAILFGIALARATGNTEALIFDYPSGILVASLVFALVGAIASYVSLAGLYFIWKEKSWPGWRRIRHTAAVLIYVGLALTLGHWNVIGFHYF